MSLRDFKQEKNLKGDGKGKNRKYFRKMHS